MKRHLLYLVSGIWLLVSPAFAIIDTNGNGLSDLWEKAHNNDQLFPNTFDPQADDDQDGWTNAEEAAAGTDPADPNPPDGLVRPDTAHIPATYHDPDEDGIPDILTPETITLTWPTISGKKYTLLVSTDLAPESWLPCGQDATFIGNGNQVTYGFPTSISARSFWRIAVTDADSDEDGVSDAEEGTLGTNPALVDSDYDGLPDWWELANDLNPTDSTGLNGASGDPDADDIVNIREFNAGTAANNASDFPVHLLMIDKGASAGYSTNEPGSDYLYHGEYEWWTHHDSGSDSGQSSQPYDTAYLQGILASFDFPATPQLARGNGWLVESPTLTSAISTSGWVALRSEPSPEFWQEMGGLGAKRIWLKTPASTSPHKIHFLRTVDKSIFASDSSLSEHEIIDAEIIDFDIGTTASVSAPVDLDTVPEAIEDTWVHMYENFSRFSIEDNTFASGIDNVSITAANNPNNGHQDKFWIMAPDGVDLAGAACQNEMQFVAAGAPFDRIYITAPGTIPLKIDGVGSYLWHGASGETAEIAPTYKLGGEEVDFPVAVKSMKHRTVKVICYMVRMPGYSDDIVTCGKAHLEATLNEIFARQINAWFNVEIKTPNVYPVDFDVDNNLWMNATTAEGNTAPDASEVISKVPRDDSGDIHIYFTNFHVAMSNTPPRQSGDDGSAGVHAATPKDGNSIFVGPWASSLPSDVERTRVLAHEIGHVMCGEGHPDQGSGEAPLEGTNRLDRLMYTYIRHKIESGVLLKNLLVKNEWDKAETWLKSRPNGDN